MHLWSNLLRVIIVPSATSASSPTRYGPSRVARTNFAFIPLSARSSHFFKEIQMMQINDAAQRGAAMQQYLQNRINSYLNGGN